VSQSNQISRRNFLSQAGTLLTGFLVLSIRPSWAAGKNRLVCKACHATIKASKRDDVVCCPNCGREWLTVQFALKRSLPHRYRYHEPVASNPRWDYAQVPFPNFEMLETSDKPVLSMKQMTFSGRGAA